MLLNYHIGRLLLSSLCVGDLVRLILGGVRFAAAQRTENKTTAMVIQQHSRRLLKMDILMFETC